METQHGKAIQERLRDQEQERQQLEGILNLCAILRNSSVSQQNLTSDHGYSSPCMGTAFLTYLHFPRTRIQTVARHHKKGPDVYENKMDGELKDKKQLQIFESNKLDELQKQNLILEQKYEHTHQVLESAKSKMYEQEILVKDLQNKLQAMKHSLTKESEIADKVEELKYQ